MQKTNNLSDSSPLLLNTDQSICYNETGVEIPCDGSGQDGEFNSKLNAPENRFLIRKDVVWDRLTGLGWSRDAAPAIFPMSWTEAFDHVSELNESSYLGVDCWRLPSRREIYSLISHRHINPALPGGHPFLNVFSGYYWTEIPSSRLKNQAWYIHLGGGRIYRGMKEGSYMVWPVTGPRADEMAVSDRFVSTQNTLQDRLTGRIWMKSEDKMARPATWRGAFDVIDELNSRRAGGYGDWRLPNIRELDSLVNLSSHSPALPEAMIQGPVAEGYWSATTSAFEKQYAWVLYARDGGVGVGFKTLPDFCVWAVRREKMFNQMVTR